MIATSSYYSFLTMMGQPPEKSDGCVHLNEIKGKAYTMDTYEYKLMLRRYEHIKKKYSLRQKRYDASQRLAYGLCKKYGIDLPKGASPAEAWAALQEKTGKSASDVYNESGSKGAAKVRFNTANAKTFTKNLKKAKATQSPRDAWRVTDMSRQGLRENHPNAKLHVTDGGSTIAIDNGDIVGVCKNKNDSLRGKELLAYAVKNGGTKLDSYEGNNGFYTKCGFEPVSWCKWDPNYEDGAKAQGWNPEKDKREAIIFYKYVGPGNVKYVGDKGLEAFKKAVKPTEGGDAYDKAYSQRDAQIKEKSN